MVMEGRPLVSVSKSAYRHESKTLIPNALTACRSGSASQTLQYLDCGGVGLLPASYQDHDSTPDPNV